QGQFLIFSLLVLTGVVAAAFIYLRPAEETYVLDVYQYTYVGTRDFRDLIVTTGTVAPETVEVARAPLAARVQAVHVAAGDDVETGAVLVELVSETLLDNVAKARHEAEAAALELEQARLKADADVETGAVLVELVSETLLDNVAKARHEAEAAALELEQARLKADADVLAKEQELEEAERRLRDAEERLPYMEELYALGGVSAAE